jgi:hypothetical protein
MIEEKDVESWGIEENFQRTLLKRQAEPDNGRLAEEVSG